MGRDDQQGDLRICSSVVVFTHDFDELLAPADDAFRSRCAFEVLGMRSVARQEIAFHIDTTGKALDRAGVELCGVVANWTPNPPRGTASRQP